MSYRLVIANRVEFPVEFSLNEAGKTRSFKFFLQAERNPELSLQPDHPDRERSWGEVLPERITGWRDQTLVLDEEGRPADFSPEALKALFSVPGVFNIVLQAYVEASGVKGKQKN